MKFYHRGAPRVVEHQGRNYDQFSHVLNRKSAAFGEGTGSPHTRLVVRCGECLQLSFFADDAFLFVSLICDLQCGQDEVDVSGMRVSRSEAKMVVFCLQAGSMLLFLINLKMFQQILFLWSDDVQTWSISDLHSAVKSQPEKFRGSSLSWGWLQLVSEMKPASELRLQSCQEEKLQSSQVTSDLMMITEKSWHHHLERFTLFTLPVSFTFLSSLIS